MRRWISAFILVIFLAPHVYAQADTKRGIQSYGDHCELCGEYGYCNRQASHKEAVIALRSYYEKRGLRVRVVKQKDRFLEAEVYNDGAKVDSILLDLKTGRIRSIY